MNDETSATAPPNKHRYFPGYISIAIVLVLIAAIVFLQMTDVTRDRALANVYSYGLALFVFAWMWIWFLAFSSYASATRWGAFGGLVALIVAFNVCFRFSHFTGDLGPVFVWRWSERDLAAPTTGDEVDLETTTANDFPQFLGPNRDLSLARIRLKAPWSQYPPKLMWRQGIGEGWSGFAVRNGFAVTMEQRDEKEMVTCYEVKTGKMRWYYAHDARYQTRLGFIGPRATPTINGGMVYALGATGLLVCLNGADGTLKWKKDLVKEFGKTTEQEKRDLPFGRSNSPLVVGDLVIVPIGGPPKNRVSLAAFKKHNGALVWQGGNRHIGYSSPNTVTLAGKRQIVLVTEAHTAGYDPKSGNVLWEFDWYGRSNANAISSQAVAIGDDKVFVSKGYGGGCMLVKVIDENGQFTTKQVWRNQRDMRTKFTNVAVNDDYVYGLSDGILECVNLKTAKRVWKDGRYGHGQILRVSDHLLVSAEDGQVWLVEATPHKTNHVLGQIEAISGTTWNNIALYGPYLLVRNAREAACFRLAIDED